MAGAVTSNCMPGTTSVPDHVSKPLKDGGPLDWLAKVPPPDAPENEPDPPVTVKPSVDLSVPARVEAAGAFGAEKDLALSFDCQSRGGRQQPNDIRAELPGHPGGRVLQDVGI